MGTPRTYNRLLNTQIKMFAAWLPVTNTFRLGDYGLMSGGVFHQIGHISEFLGGDAVGLVTLGPATTARQSILKVRVP